MFKLLKKYFSPTLPAAEYVEWAQATRWASDTGLYEKQKGRITREGETVSQLVSYKEFYEDYLTTAIQRDLLILYGSKYFSSNPGALVVVGKEVWKEDLIFRGYEGEIKNSFGERLYSNLCFEKKALQAFINIGRLTCHAY